MACACIWDFWLYIYIYTADVPNHWKLYFMRPHQGFESVIFSVLNFNFDFTSCCHILPIEHTVPTKFTYFDPSQSSPLLPLIHFSPFYNSGDQDRPLGERSRRASTRYRLMSPWPEIRIAFKSQFLIKKKKRKKRNSTFFQPLFFILLIYFFLLPPLFFDQFLIFLYSRFLEFFRIRSHMVTITSKL